ncbi:MAG: threonine/serine exporter family protein [Gemmatimonadales bacterium]
MTDPQSHPGERIPFVLDLASALHEAGHATHRLEEALQATGERLGLHGQYFATPTSIFASFGQAAVQQTFMLRTHPRPPDLGRLSRVTAIAREVLRGDVSPTEGSRRLAGLVDRPAPGAAALVAAHALASGAAARFLGGAGPEIAVAAAAGTLIGILALVALAVPNVGRVYELLAAFVCSAAVAAAGAAVGGFSVSIATLAGLIVLIPGLTLTTAIAELATSHLTAGTTRMAGAFMTFIAIGFGVALGARVAAMAVGPSPSVAAGTIAPAANWVALAATGVAFAILLRADRDDLGWIIASGVLAFVATRAGGALGPELGVFVGALAVGLGSSLVSRLTERPAAVMLSRAC